MTDLRCTFCLESGHLKAACPKAAAFISSAFPEFVSPTTADEVNDALAERLMLYRTCKNGFLGYARERGWTFPVTLLKLDPDYVE